MPPEKISIYDIAEKTGTAASTVSRALDNSALISRERRGFIQKTARQMGFYRRSTCRQQNRKIFNISLVLSSAPSAGLNLFYDFSELLAGLKDGLGKIKYHLSVELIKKNETSMQNKKAYNPHGIIYAFTTPGIKTIAICRKNHLPVMVLNRIIKNLSYVSAGNQQGIITLFNRAAEKIKNLKPCFIAYAGNRDISAQRKNGFLRACKETGIRQGKIFTIKNPDQISAKMAASLSRHYNLAMCFNDLFALRLIQMCHQAKISIPAGLAVTGYDCAPVRNLFIPAIDTITLPVYEMGREAGIWMREQMIEKKNTLLQKIIPGEYIRGETIHA
ncbi:MAG: hypothetical protein A2096_16465 [Spirochaetes bacterium GWF1_41_5]|nr:MAG: hypothetical protein A2096_16465 [Spirochaetes bacterium GWF1_41_5]HBE01819.1 hypothetical protein [Spirochaetia bacterium]